MNGTPSDTPLATAKVVEIVYTNYRDETSTRRIVPERFWWGATPWHPAEQWLLDAYDVDKREVRSFAVNDITRWAGDTGDVRN